MEQNTKMCYSRKFYRKLNREKYLWLIFLPVLAYFIIFAYMPMYGIVIAFKKFDPIKGYWGSPWVGFKYFKEFFKSIYFLRLIKNTILINVYNIIFSFPIPIIFAILLNELPGKVFKRVIQTISYLPHFISTVVVVGMIVNFLSPLDGIINIIIRYLGGKTIEFMIKPEWFRTIYIVSDIWQSMGWNSIIYLAAITGISQELYEAAHIDGASRMRLIWNITLPSISPTIILLLILNIGSLLSLGSEKILLMYNPLTYETADVISTYVYRAGILNSQYELATAVGFFNSVINFILLIIANRLSRRLSETSLW